MVLPHTVRALERECPRQVPLFEHFKIAIVSTEFIKSPERFRQFVDQAPGFIIVDEAPWLFLYEPLPLYGVSNKLNWKVRSDEFIYVEDMTAR